MRDGFRRAAEHRKKKKGVSVKHSLVKNRRHNQSVRIDKTVEAKVQIPVLRTENRRTSTQSEAAGENGTWS